MKFGCRLAFHKHPYIFRISILVRNLAKTSQTLMKIVTLLRA